MELANKYAPLAPDGNSLQSVYLPHQPRRANGALDREPCPAVAGQQQRAAARWRNGLLLTPSDHLFDKGFSSFENSRQPAEKDIDRRCCFTSLSQCELFCGGVCVLRRDSVRRQRSVCLLLHCATYIEALFRVSPIKRSKSVWRLTRVLAKMDFNCTRTVSIDTLFAFAASASE